MAPHKRQQKLREGLLERTNQFIEECSSRLGGPCLAASMEWRTVAKTPDISHARATVGNVRGSRYSAQVSYMRDSRCVHKKYPRLDKLGSMGWDGLSNSQSKQLRKNSPNLGVPKDFLRYSRVSIIRGGRDRVYLELSKTRIIEIIKFNK
ncbi:hypothetical protein AVEN_29341-1 [Araneus ventricosus]|uniref:Uncharacterized protein n=1 Tax=Araneus ventricosus TaxID=182803 RepID=A0A4Y2J066_ARAVE|nr:hypothetical protein AVEN_29341-1 [Araneus ventricosus]